MARKYLFINRMRRRTDRICRPEIELTLQILRDVNDFCAVAKWMRGELSA
jgi:hypothetical protein